MPSTPQAVGHHAGSHLENQSQGRASPSPEPPPDQPLVTVSSLEESVHQNRPPPLSATHQCQTPQRPMPQHPSSAAPALVNRERGSSKSSRHDTPRRRPRNLPSA